MPDSKTMRFLGYAFLIIALIAFVVNWDIGTPLICGIVCFVGSAILGKLEG